MIELYPIQQRAVAKLAGALRELGCALNASATGTGKTLVGLEVARSLGLKPLIVAPLAAHGAWRAWSGELGVPIDGPVNPERLKTGRTPWMDVVESRGVRSSRWNLDRETQMVEWDEIHRGMSGVRTQIGASAAMLRPQGIKTLLMSATPFSSPLQLRNSGYLLRLHDFSLASFYGFCRRRGCSNSPFHRGLVFNPESRTAPYFLGLIREALQDRLVRLTVDDLKEYFPEQIVEPTLISLVERDRAEVEAIYAEMEAEVRRKNANPVVEMMRARQRAELLAVPAIAEMVVDSLEEGFSVFVSHTFRASVAALRAKLEELDVKDVLVLTGDTPAKDRPELERAFQADEARVFLASEAGGESISLHKVREEQRPRTSILRPSYKASALSQALGRIYRAGKMKHPVVQRVVLCSGTVEERVYRKLQAKMRNIASLVDGDLE